MEEYSAKLLEKKNYWKNMPKRLRYVIEIYPKYELLFVLTIFKFKRHSSLNVQISLPRYIST